MQQLLIIFFLFFFIGSNGQGNHPSPQYKLINGTNAVAAKNYYLLTLLQEKKAVRSLLENDTVLNRILLGKFQQLEAALATCNTEIQCFTEAAKFTPGEISEVALELTSLYNRSEVIKKLITEDIIPSGTYILYHALGGAALLAKAWEQDAVGINFVIDVYGAGKRPNYPNIDSISFKVNAPGFSRLIYSVQYLTQAETRRAKLFFLPSLTAALHLLAINERNQAADFEPMVFGENKASLQRIPAIVWNKYKYSVIMVPGAGPDEPAVALSAEGIIRCRLAALQYKNGLAPFIVTSGGKVHPYKTKFCEATEMKRYLVEEMHIPASVIIIDPHARHTTTNMRNTARLIFRYGMPFDKPALTCTTRGQSSMIENTLIARCQKELNEIPYKNGKRLDETLMEFYPAPEALQINPSEPMDP
jgi:uncharacterized SAM-binding protein YcdF (DUF218 family)